MPIQNKTDITPKTNFTKRYENDDISPESDGAREYCNDRQRLFNRF